LPKVDVVVREGTPIVATPEEDVKKDSKPLDSIETPKITGPKLTVMILTQPSRAPYLSRLMSSLTQQIGNGNYHVEVLTRIFDESMDLGTNRKQLREQAKGEYSVFIDDDDIVADDYFSKIYPLLDGVDYIAYNIQLFIDGNKQKPTYHSLKYTKWSEDDSAYYRDLSHVNPIKTELALKVKMSGGHGEDARWANELRTLKVVRSEHYINEPMYFYYFRTSKDHSPVQLSGQPVIAHASGPISKKACPKCGSGALGMAGGMRRCNQCGHAF